MGKSLLIISAHADDAEFFAGGTIASFAEAGFEIVEVITTNNERGSFELDSTTLVEQSRKVEAMAAAKIVGKKEVIFLEYPDGFLGDTPINVLREQYMRFIRKYRPDILMTFDPWAPFETHPDHRQVAFAAVEAVSFAQLPLYHPEHIAEGFKPHLVPERYYFAKDTRHCDKAVNIEPFLTRKIDALCAHDSQMRSTIDEFRLSLEVTGDYPGLLPLLDRENYRPAMELFISAWANQVGKKFGLEMAEEFRYERAGSLFADFDVDLPKG